MAQALAEKRAVRAEAVKAHGQTYFVLNSGRRIPAIGLGTWKAPPNVVRDSVYAALVEGGYRHIDCAFIYDNQEEVGAGLRKAFDAGVKREDIYITSKLWTSSNSPEKVKPGLELTLKQLGLEYLDLYLVHWPVHTVENSSMPPKEGQVLPLYTVGVWRALEGLVKEGLVRDIGLSNFSVPKVEEVLSSATVKPAVLQVEMHPAWRNDKILQHAKLHDYHVTAYSPLGSSSTDILDDPAVTEVAHKLGRTPAQVLLRWLIQRGVSTIPKASSEHRIKENLNVFDWTISAEDMQKISSISYQKRTNPGTEVFVTPDQSEATALSEFWGGDV